MAHYLLAIDQGTTGTTSVLIDKDGRAVAKATVEFPQHYPKPGWVEHEPEEIWSSVVASVQAVMREADASGKDCAAIGITNQRETTLLWDRRTGQPLHRAIVWQDRRTADHCEQLKRAGHEEAFSQRTGLVLDPYFSGTKLAWLFSNVDSARARGERGDLCFGTVDSYLIYRLTGGRVHLTDVTNASRTLLYDIHQGAWAGELCERLDIPLSVLPEVRGCAEVYGETAGVPGLPDGIPIAGVAGDQHAALFGQTCFEVGDAKCTYGTGAFLLVNTGSEAVPSRHGLLTTVAWQLGENVTYALEGSAFIAGAAVQWLRDGLGLISHASEVEALAAAADPESEVVFVPALVGLGAPHWDPRARGLITGITRDTSAADLARATLRGIAHSIFDLSKAMEADSDRALTRLRVDGGASKNDALMQAQADLLRAQVDRPASIETTALGAAYLAGLGTGFFADQSAVVAAHQIERTFTPSMSEDVRSLQLSRWRDAVARARSIGIADES